MNAHSIRFLLLPILFFSVTASADALIECQSPAIAGGDLWVKISEAKGILPITDEAWLESDEVSVFKKLTEPLKLGHYLKQTSAVSADGTMVLDLETAVELLKLEILKDQKAGRYTITSKADAASTLVQPLVCKPDQVPSPH